MAFLVLTVALVSFLAGVAVSVFTMLVIGIRKGDRPERILESGSSPLDASTRRVLGSGTWPTTPVYYDDREYD